MKNHKELLSHYKLMYDNMMKINATVSHLLATVHSMQENLDERINWFSHLLNIAGMLLFYQCLRVLFLRQVVALVLWVFLDCLQKAVTTF